MYKRYKIHKKYNGAVRPPEISEAVAVWRIHGEKKRSRRAGL